ncbi:TonB-dependent receptor [Flavobacterium sp. CYK-4]|uniref:outer membrane beta-barrel protein n=1 Tax=Flavobacterium lotistagni TaxID=2709660 RepID=UPI00140C6F6F|nr:outer membrane beta-barrel protein [Flavobacterium lotistagni]NHM07431.1 TonB-dependent receptor [Flavobacterium lotistagni]
MKNWLLLISWLCISFVHAQQAKISGKFETPEATSSVLVVLQKAEDFSVVKSQFLESDGRFEFLNLQAGNYLVVIDQAQFKPFQSQTIALANDQQLELPTVRLEKNETKLLNEVVVQKRKPFVENKIDRTVVNVDALITTAGGDAVDVLEKSPGILVDQNGTITFKGKSGVQVFIDDKPTYLSGAELEAYLKSLPASTLDKIELMTNPPAKYDAAGGAGVINIVTKKSKTRGFNGNVTSRFSQGKRSQFRQGLNLNYVDEKYRVYGNLGYANQNPLNDLFIFRRFKNPDGSTKSLFYQDSFLRTSANTGNAKVGMDYYYSDKTTFGLSVSGILKSSRQKSDVRSVLTDATNIVDSTIIANNRENEKFRNLGLNLNYRHDIDSIGRRITVDLDYLNYDTQTRQQFNNFVYQPDNSLSSQDALRGDLPTDIDIYSFKTDYTHPLKKGSFEAGYKVSFSKTDNIADYRDIVGDAEVPNYDTSNHFKYDETINAAYLNYNTNLKRFSFQLGLRVENTDSKGNQLGNVVKPSSRFSRNYTNLFPTVYVQYKMDSIGNHQLVVNYGKRINRPYFQDLNPFVSPLDKFTFYSGNPYLNPSFADNYELSYRYKEYLSTTFSYGRSSDEINETIEITDQIYYSRPGNIGRSEFFSCNVNATIPFNKWWTATAYTEVTHSRFKSQLYTETLDASGSFWFFQMNNTFKFKNDWSAELSGTYHTDIVSSQFVLLSRSNINMGVQKKILKSKGSLKFSVNDIFYSNLNNGIIRNIKLTDANWRNRPDSRFAALTFTYSFGKSLPIKQQYNANGADTEKNRVKD